MHTKRTAIEQALWAAGKLDDQRQAVLDAACRGEMSSLPPLTSIVAAVSEYRLMIDSPFTETPPRFVALPRPEGLCQGSTETATTRLTLLSNDFQEAGDLLLDVDPGLALYLDQPYRFSGAFRRSPAIGWSMTASSGFVPAPGGTYGPLDLVVRQGGDDALVIDRGLGVIYHVDLQAGEVLRRIQVRRTARSFARIAVAWIGNRIVCASGVADTVKVFDLWSGESVTAPVGLAHVSNLVASPDGLTLYRLTSRPAPILAALHADTHELLWSVPLKGEAFSRLDGSPDPLAISPDGQRLAVITAIDAPEVGTPLLSGIAADKGQVVKMIRLGKRPQELAFAIGSPFQAELEPVEAAVVRLGYVTQAELRQMLGAPPAVGDDFEPLPPDHPETRANGGDRLGATIDPADPMALPIELERLIAEHVQKAFQEQTGRNVPADAGARLRVSEAATVARERLERQAAAEVYLPELAPHHDLRLLISREQVQEWLEVLAQIDAATLDALEAIEPGLGLRALPDKCPVCATPLMGCYQCQGCGHQVTEAPVIDSQSAAQPKQDRKATPTGPRPFLAPERLLLADPPRRRVVELDRRGRITRQIPAERAQPGLEERLLRPIDAVRLPNGHTMIIDQVGRRVFEVTEQGRLHWEWPSPAGALQEPVRVARSEWGETLIVDRQAHRIWSVDAKGRALAPIGGDDAGIGAEALSSPTDVQVLSHGHFLITDSGNHRVFELARGEVVWQYGHSGYGDDESRRGSLHLPLRAFRLEAGRTLILDAGNHRLLLLNRQSDILWEHDTLAGDADTAIEHPVGMMPLSRGRIAYWDGRCVVLLNRDGSIGWAGLIEALNADALLPAEAPTSPRPASSPPPPDAGHAEAPGTIPLLCVQPASGRLVHMDREEHVVWAWGQGVLEKPQSARLLPDGHVLVADTAHNRLLEVDTTTDTVIWESPAGLLRAPMAASKTHDGHVLVADAGHQRVVELTPEGRTEWEWRSAEYLKVPCSCERLANGNTLITDRGRHVVVEVNRAGDVVWLYGSPGTSRREEGFLSHPQHASRLETGHTVIVDSRNDQVLEVDSEGLVVWRYAGVVPQQLRGPMFALSQGEAIWILHAEGRQIHEVSRAGQVRRRIRVPI